MSKLKSTAEKILEAIPRTEPCTFNEFCSNFADTPQRGDKDAWAHLFDQLSVPENLGLIEIERNDRRIQSLQLTEAGAARLSELRAKAF